MRQFIDDEISNQRAAKPDVGLETQGRIVQQVRQLAEQGHLIWPKGKAAPARAKRQQPDAKYQAMERAFAKELGRTLEQMQGEEIDQLFVHLGKVARAEGILALEEYAAEMADPYIQQAVQLAVDGAEPDLIVDILQTWMKSRMHENECKNLKVIEGIMAVQSGDHPRIIETKLSKIY